MKLLENVKKFVKDERGLETTEYAVLAGLIAVGTVAIVIALREKIITVFQGLINVLPG